MGHARTIRTGRASIATTQLARSRAITAGMRDVSGPVLWPARTIRTIVATEATLHTAHSKRTAGWRPGDRPRRRPLIAGGLLVGF